MAEIYNEQRVLGVHILQGGGGAAQEVEVSNFPETQAVSGTVTVNGLSTAGSTNLGSTGVAAYTDPTGAASGSTNALLKGIYVQNAQIISLLTAIEANTNTGA